MRVIRFCLSLATLFSASLLLADNNSTDPPMYEVNEVALPPVIDGVIDEGEWDLAAPAAGDWVGLRDPHAPDQHNLRFRMLWDADNLYILGETDYDGFRPPTDSLGNPNTGGETYNPNFYFDPNTDAEDFADLSRAVDGYQFAWSVESGFFIRQPTAGMPERSLRDPLDAEGEIVNDYISGLYAEAHVSTPFGNNGALEGVGDNSGPNANWRDDALPGLVYAQNADNSDLNGTGQAGGLWEFAISWDTFNATNPARLLQESDGDLVDPGSDAFLGEVGAPDPRFADPESEAFLENGLFAAEGPAVGDVWGFETSVITNDLGNFLPSWSEPQGGDTVREVFSAWGESGHGRITFLGIQPTCDPNTGGDFNGNGLVDFPDFLVLSANFGSLVESHTDGDNNCNGIVDFPDFLILSSSFGRPPTIPGDGGAAVAASVPEPSSMALLLLGMVWVLRRKRS